MAITASSPEKISNEASEPRKRTKDPGVRVVGGRVYDSENGTTCHQCRQKTMDFTAGCRRVGANRKPCRIRFCHKCLLNRYGEKAEVVAELEDWSCPKCRGVCNCSFCMKKKGHAPTGILIHAAKATGFVSVLELLDNKGADVAVAIGLAKSKEKLGSPAPKGSPTMKAGQCDQDSEVGQDKNVVHSTCLSKERRWSKKVEIGSSGDVNGCNYAAPAGNAKESPTQKRKNVMEEVDRKQFKKKKCSKRLKMEETDSNNIAKDVHDIHSSPGKARNIPKESLIGLNTDVYAETEQGCAPSKQVAGVKGNFVDRVTFVPPQGTLMTKVSGIQLQPKEIGLALQFLEFCRTFGKVFKMKKDQAELILQELVKGRIGRRGVPPVIAQFHLNLLSAILKDRGEMCCSKVTGDDSEWIKQVQRCLDGSNCQLKELELDCLDEGPLGYDRLGLYGKLVVLNFLCDEALATNKLRDWIEEGNAKLAEKRRQAKENVAAARKKLKELKDRLKANQIDAILSPTGGGSLSRRDITKLRENIRKAQSELVQTLQNFQILNHGRDVIRIDPMIPKYSGKAYWKLDGYCDDSAVILQEFQDCSLLSNEDKWFTLNADEEKMIERHVVIIRMKKSNLEVA